MEHDSPLPFVVHLDDSDEPSDVIETLALGRFVTGDQPWARSKRLQRVRPDSSLLPAGVTASHGCREGGWRSHLAVGDGWTLRAVRWTDRTARVVVTARTDELAEAILAAATDGAEEPPMPEGNEVSIGFWHLSGHGPKRVARTIDVEPWGDIRRNYSLAAVAALDRLMGLEAAALNGRLVLLYGPPGTGKTTALRALAQRWRRWCQVDYILDPERLLKEPAYLMDVVLGDDEDDDDRWRLLVLEDCDELIRSEAKQGTGQSLARLLNLTDGMVGQGLNVLICITTNEPVSRLHPAIVRPGRCVAQIHVGPLSRSEAIAWLGRANRVGADGATLAELCALRNDAGPVRQSAGEPRIGQYL